MKRFAGLLQRIRGWVQDIGDALQGKDLDVLKTGSERQETLVFLTPLAPALILMGGPGNGSSQN